MLKFFREKLEGCFTFSFSDLELCRKYEEKGQKRRKCRIISEELSNKLHQIYSKGKKGYIPPIRFIDLDLTKKEDKFEFFYFEVANEAYPFESKMEVHEESLNKETKVLSDGTLVIPFMKNVNENIKYDIESKKFVFLWSSHFFSVDFCERKARESHSARSSALSQIKKAFQQGNIDPQELGFEYIDDLRIRECLC